MTLRIGFLISHPIQYYVPLFRELAKRCDLTVYFAHRQTAEQQARAGFGVAFHWDIDLLAGYHSRFLTNVSRRPSTDSFWGCNTPDVGREIAAGRFDAFVVPGWALLSYWQAVRASRRAGIPVFVRGDSHLTRRRDPWVRAVKALAYPQLLRRFDGFLYVGQWNRDYLVHYGAPQQRLFFSPHCIDNDAFRAGSEAARQRRASRPDRKRILFVGKLMPNKNPLDLLRAAALVQGRGTALEVAFAGSGEMTGELERFAQSAGLAVQFHGFVNQTELPGIYASADMIVLPSEAETWGLVINEAMACGLPAVVSDGVGCAPDLIEPGATGAVFQVGDVAGLARSIETVLALDLAECRRRLATRMQVYSPEAAADGILRAANGHKDLHLVG